MKTIGITGGSGFVGRHLTDLLRQQGYSVVIFTRHPEKHHTSDGVQYSYWEPAKNKCDLLALKNLDAVVNLAGTSIEKRWTPKNKNNILNSRVNGTHFLVSKLKKHSPNCKTFISASAVGFYGVDKNGAAFTENDAPADDFLAGVCRKWEKSAFEARDTMRTVIFRFGIVLGKDGGAFQELSRTAPLGILPVMGSGKQVMSWVHVDDLVSMFNFAITNAEMSGVYNAVAPEQVSQKQLMKTIGQVKGGFAIAMPVPKVALQVILGEMSTELLKSCTVSCKKILDADFKFRYPGITDAVSAIIKSKNKIKGSQLSYS